MTYNGIRDSTTIVGYFPSPSRPNIIANAPKTQVPGVGPEFVTSIGVVQCSGLKEVGSGSIGPGTFSNTNINIQNPNCTSYAQLGHVFLNDKKESFVDYRQTAPFLIDALTRCPLSIYGVGAAKDAEILPVETYIRPEYYNTYKTETQKVSKTSIEGRINGSPQIDILGLYEENPMMGLRQVPNNEPTFSGKTYGGMTGSAEPYADKLYRQASQPGGQNKALLHFAPGYNIAGQIIQNRMVAEVGPKDQRPFGGRGRDNIPWGPRTSFQSGIWPRGNDPMPTQPTATGYVNR